MSDGHAAYVTCPRCGHRSERFDYEGLYCEGCRPDPQEDWSDEDFERDEADRKNKEEAEERIGR